MQTKVLVEDGGLRLSEAEAEPPSSHRVHFQNARPRSLASFQASHTKEQRLSKRHIHPPPTRRPEILVLVDCGGNLPHISPRHSGVRPRSRALSSEIPNPSWPDVCHRLSLRTVFVPPWVRHVRDSRVNLELDLRPRNPKRDVGRFRQHILGLRLKLCFTFKDRWRPAIHTWFTEGETHLEKPLTFGDAVVL